MAWDRIPCEVRGHMILQQFEKYHLFRRLIIVFLLILYAYVTIESFNMAYYCIDSKLSATDTVMIITALQALMTTLLGYVYKQYSNSRDDQNG